MLLGLDIGSTAIRACAIERNKGATALSLFDSEDLPKESVTNGVVIDASTVIDTLRALLERAPARSPQVVIALPYSSVRCQRAQLALKKGAYHLEDLHDAVATQLPAQWSDVHLSVSPFDPDDLEDVLVVAAPKAAVRSLRHIVREAGGELVGLDAAPSVGFNLLEHTGVLQNNTALVDVGYQESRIYLFQNQRLIDVKTFPRGGFDIQESLQQRLDLSEDEAARYIIGGYHGTPTGVVPRDVHDQLCLSSETLADGIWRVIQQAGKRAGMASFESLQCVGRGADLHAFYDRLAVLSQADVRLPAPLRALDTTAFDTTSDYLDAIRGASSFAFGAALPWIH